MRAIRTLITYASSFKAEKALTRRQKQVNQGKPAMYRSIKKVLYENNNALIKVL